MIARLAQAAVGSQARAYAFTALIAGSDANEGLALRWLAALSQACRSVRRDDDLPVCWRAAIEAFASRGWVSSPLGWQLRRALQTLPAPETALALRQQLQLVIAFEALFWRPGEAVFCFDGLKDAAAKIGARVCTGALGLAVPNGLGDWVDLAGHVHQLQSRVFGPLRLDCLAPQLAAALAHPCSVRPAR